MNNTFSAIGVDFETNRTKLMKTQTYTMQDRQARLYTPQSVILFAEMQSKPFITMVSI